MSTPHWAYSNSVIPARSPYTENCLGNARRQAACEASKAQNNVHGLGKRWYYQRKEVLYGKCAKWDDMSMRAHHTPMK